jgi:uncharacterized protein (DUF433 family)
MSTTDLKGIVHSDPEIMGGTPVFVGTRVPLQNLIDYLEGGESIEDFLDGFPSVKREQVVAVIEAGKAKVMESLKPCVSRSMSVSIGDWCVLSLATISRPLRRWDGAA